MASTIKVDNVQNQPGTNIINKCGTTITLGASSDTIALAAGASQTGFGRTGTVDWVTTPKVTGDSPVTAATGSGYFLNTTAGAITINLPAGAAGSIVSMADYAATWQTNNVTVAANGSEKIGGELADAVVSTKGQSVTFVYVDGTQGWVNTMDSTSNVRGAAPYIVATGGTPCAGTTCGDYKIHKFTGPGTFCVSTAAVCAADNLVSYMVVAGGGSGGDGGTTESGGAGGGGGYREVISPTAPYSGSPTEGYPSAPNRITVSATGYPIVVGGGASSSGSSPGGGNTSGVQGATSTFSTIDSAGGGGGTSGGGSASAGPTGGSGGGGNGRTINSGTAGNTPPTTPAQGFNGGNGLQAGAYAGGGGGGATAVGGNASSPNISGSGGTGATTSISGTPTGYAGGGGGGTRCSSPYPAPATQGGGAGGTGSGPAAGAGTINTGGGGGGNGGPNSCGGAGGSGIVIIRYKFQ